MAYAETTRCGSEAAAARAMVDAIREILGLEPLYARELRTDLERFGGVEREWLEARHLGRDHRWRRPRGSGA